MQATIGQDDFDISELLVLLLGLQSTARIFKEGYLISGLSVHLVSA